MDGNKRHLLSWKFFTTLTNKKAFLIIFILGIIVFSNSIFNNFIGDDFFQIVNNIPVHSIKNIPTFFTGGTFYSGEAQRQVGVYYKPLLNIIFSLIYTIFGPSVYPFHLFQIFLHILNACLLFLFLKHFFKKPLSLILSLIFLVHPINSEAVFYISGTQEPLFFFFGILALLILSNSESKKYLLFSGVLLFLSLLSKETGILFFFVALVYTFIFNRKSFLALLGLSIAPVIFYFLLRTNAVGIFTAPSSSSIAKLTLLGRFLNMPAMMFFYIKTFLFPLNLAYFYQWVYKQASFSHFVSPLIIDFGFLVTLLYFAVIIFKRHLQRFFMIYTIFGLWFLIGLLFHLQILPLDLTVSERWFYFPVVGLVGMIGVLLEVFHFNFKNNWVLSIAILILVLLSVRTFIRSFDWRDEFKLDTHDVKVSKDSYALENGITVELTRRGQFEEAKQHAERSIQIFPHSFNYTNLGNVYFALGDYKKAREAYLKAIEFGDNYYGAYENLALLGLVSGDFHENIDFIEQAIKKFPQDAKLWLSLAILKYNNKDIDGAKTAIANAYTYDKNSETVYFYNQIMSDQPLDLHFNIGK
jgi:tetratricopeptide (TPR) repeat protein